MKEDFLHFLWRTRRLDLDNLTTTNGDPVQILNFGSHNANAGPDFLNAKIKIGETIWAGNIEIHVRSSEWKIHGHQFDKAYDNVILHLVYEEDEIIKRSKTNECIPCLELRERIPKNIIYKYEKLQHNEHWIPCHHHFHTVAEWTKNLWLDRMVVERLERKTEDIARVLTVNKNNWEETFYRFLAKNFGLKVNAFPFEMLAQSLPLLTLLKHKDNVLQIESLLFGQAGMLAEDFEETYPQQLKKEYTFLKNKHQLTAIPVQSWRFLRMRPANFPTIRLAQFSALMSSSAHLFSKILEVETVKDIEALFQISPQEYWKTHYTFDKISEEKTKKLGKSTVHLLIINTIVPFLFLYGKQKAEEDYKNKALRLLEELKAEKNLITKGWQQLGMKPDSAYQSQALLELKNEYCTHKKCLTCAIGAKILKAD